MNILTIMFTVLLFSYSDNKRITEEPPIPFIVSTLQKVCKNGVELLNVYNDLLRLEQELIGLVKFNRTVKNHMYFNVKYQD